MAKAPLESIPTERAVIGALLKDPHLVWSVKDRARPSVFVLHSHRKIIEIIHTLLDANRGISIGAIVSRYPNDSDDFSPAGYMATLISDEAEPEQLHQLLEDLEEMAARRDMIQLGQELIRQATDDSGLGAIERIDKAKAEIDAINDPMGSTIKHASDIANEVLERVNQSYASEETVGLEVGIKGLQDLIGPLMPGRLYLLGGAPGSGKTGLAQQVGMNIASDLRDALQQTVIRAAEPVLFVQIEMPGEEMIERDLARRTGIAPEAIERASLNDSEIDRLFVASEELLKTKFYIDASTSPTVSQIRAKAMRMKRTKGIKALIVDHLLYLAPPTPKMDQFEAISKNLKALKRIAKDLNIPVIILTQLKSGYDGLTWDKISRPGIGNLYGGSSLEQDVDVILLIHREEYLLLRKEPDESAKDRAEWAARLDAVEGKAELVLLKRRGGKGTGIKTVYFDGPTTSFSDSQGRRSNRSAAKETTADMLDRAF